MVDNEEIKLARYHRHTLLISIVFYYWYFLRIISKCRVFNREIIFSSVLFRAALAGKFEGSSSSSFSQASPFLPELQYYQPPSASPPRPVKRKRPIVTDVEQVSQESVSTSRQSHPSNSPPAPASGTVNRNAGLSTELSSVFSRGHSHEFFRIERWRQLYSCFFRDCRLYQTSRNGFRTRVR